MAHKFLVPSLGACAGLSTVSLDTDGHDGVMDQAARLSERQAHETSVKVIPP